MNQRPPFGREEAPSLLVFVCGIGQSFAYRFDKKWLRRGAFPKGTLRDYENHAPLIEEGAYTDTWNLFARNMGEQFRSPAGAALLAKAAAALAGSLIARKNLLGEKTAARLVRRAFRANIPAQNGGGDPKVVTPRYATPLSEYPGVTKEEGRFHSHAKYRFYRNIPCADIAQSVMGEGFEDYLYCFNYPPCSYTSENVEALRRFLDTALENNRVGAKTAVLIPMSMGASVVSAYLARYPDPAVNHVRRVVSIVGCWRGSAVMEDLIKRRFRVDPVRELRKAAEANKKNRALRFALACCSDRMLSGLFDSLLSAFVREVILGSPSLAALVPDTVYPEIRELIRNPEVRKETDAYHAAQVSVPERLRTLREQGVETFFIAGYGLGLGSVTPDYDALSYLQNADRVNSDEIIEISSTAPGAVAAPPGQKLPRTERELLSPDGGVSLGTALFPENTWLFYRQKHELEYNNVAVTLALRLALGQIGSVRDCADPAKPELYYPQFNFARNNKTLVTELLPKLDAWLKNGGRLSEEQTRLVEDVKAAMRSNAVDPEAEAALNARFARMVERLQNA